VDDPAKLRELAAWYREFAEQSGNPAIWDGRLRTAEDLEAEASQLETRSAQSEDQPPVCRVGVLSGWAVNGRASSGARPFSLLRRLIAVNPCPAKE